MKRRSLVTIGLAGLLAVSASAWGVTEAARLASERALSRFFHQPVSIRRVTFSADQITLHHIEIAYSAESSPVVIERVEWQGSVFELLKTRLLKVGRMPSSETFTLRGAAVLVAGVPLRATGVLHLDHRLRAPAFLSGQMQLNHPWIHAQAEIAGTSVKPVLIGWVDGKKMGPHRFIAQLSRQAEWVGIERLEVQGGWLARGQWTGRDSTHPFWRAELELMHDIDRYRLEMGPSGEGAMQAGLWVYREGLPPQELMAAWKPADEGIEWSARTGSGQLSGWGRISRKNWPELSMAIDLKQFDLKEIYPWFPRTIASPLLAGTFNGHLELAGIWPDLKSQGEIFGEDGKFGEFNFEGITVRFQGVGPYLRIFNSHLKQPIGPTYLEGTLDLNQTGKPDFFRNVRMLSTDPTITTAQWQMNLAGNPPLALEMKPATAAGNPIGVASSAGSGAKSVSDGEKT